MPVHCYVPIRIRLVGTPGDAELAQLSQTLARLLAARLETAHRIVAERHGGAHAGRQVHEWFDPGRESEAGYAVPAYDDGGGAPVSVPVRGPARPWVVLRSLHFRTTVGDFFDWVDQERPEPLAERALYTDLDAEVRWVSVWWVQTNLTVTVGDFSKTLVSRAFQLAHAGSRQTLVHGLTPFDRGRLDLANLDGTGVVRALPSLHERNARRVEGNGAEATLLHGSRVVFAFMVLPRVEAADLLVLGAVVVVELPLRDLTFLVDTEGFEAAFGVAWSRFAEEFGADRVPVTFRPATVRKPAATPAVGYLLSAAGSSAAGSSERAAPGAVPVQQFWLLTQAALGRMPPQVRDLARGWTDDTTLHADAAAVLDHLPAGARVLYAAAALLVDVERVVAARLRPQAREVATALRQIMADDTDDRAWKWRLYDFLGGRFGTWPPPVRPPGGSLFEHVLAVLEAGGDFGRLFDLADATVHFGLRHRLLRHSLVTTYAGHPRVQALAAALSARALSNLRHGFRPDDDPPQIWLDREPSRRVRVGDVFGDLFSLYIFERTVKELKPDRATALRKECERVRVELHRKSGSGEDQSEYSADEFSMTVLESAARTVKITEADFVEFTIQRSLELVGVRHRDIEGLPSFEVSLRFVERRKGSGTRWTAVGEVWTESADEFTARLIYWALGRAGEFYEAIGILVTGVGLFAIAWAAGLVAALVSLAGGALAVGISITISEAIYILRIIFGDAKLTPGGFLMAALEGYLMALGFRVGAGLGRLAAERLGAETLRRFLIGWVSQKLVTGVVGGALSAGLTRFANDVVNIATGRGSWSSIRTYVFHMSIGAVVGVTAEFVVAPALNAALAKGGSALESAADLAARIRAEGWGSVQLSATLTEGLANMRAALTELAGEVTAKGFTSAFAERLGPVLEQLAGGAVARRVLELAGARFTRLATEGLQRFLRAADAIAPARALRIANVFAEHPAETVHFLEVLAQLDGAAARRLVDGTFGSHADLAAFLGRLARYTPEQQQAAVRMLSELDIQAAPPVPGMTTDELLRRQLGLSLRVQGAGLRLEADGIRREIARLEERLARGDAGNVRRAEALRRQIEEQQRKLAAVEARQERAEAVGANEPRDVVPTDA